MNRTLSGKNKLSDLNSCKIENALISNALKTLKQEDHLYLLHDPSDIRKPYSKQLENLGKVRDLNNNIINGYSSFNTVAVSMKDKKVILSGHTAYSNREPAYLKKEDITAYKNSKVNSAKERNRIHELYASGEYINKVKIAEDQIIKQSQKFKEDNPSRILTHVLDREFDSEPLCKLINDKLHDEFVIRLKSSRVTGEFYDNGESIKVIESDFLHKIIKKIPKIRVKNECYQDVKVQIEWGTHIGFNVVKISMFKRDGSEIFKHPLLLITNRVVDNVEQAWLVYMIYLKRSKIECVFKFLKDSLGWEEIRLHDFEAIKNMLATCYFVAAYFYEIGEELAKDNYVKILADLGGGKGKVTRHYVLEGISMLLTKNVVDYHLTKYKVSQENQDKMNQAAGLQ